MGFLLGRGFTVGAMDDGALDSLVAVNNFFGMTVQNWMVFVAFIFLIWMLTGYIVHITRKN
jgi:hypothetical protein